MPASSIVNTSIASIENGFPVGGVPGTKPWVSVPVIVLRTATLFPVAITSSISGRRGCGSSGRLGAPEARSLSIPESAALQRITGIARALKSGGTLDVVTQVLIAAVAV